MVVSSIAFSPPFLRTYQACGRCAGEPTGFEKRDLYQPGIAEGGSSSARFESTPPVEAAGSPAAPRLYAGYPRQWLDPTTRPQEDFYQWAVGGYEAANPIPSDRARYGIRTQVYERVQTELLRILEAASRNPSAPGSVDQKIGDFYAAGMNLDAIEEAGARPLTPYLAELDQLKTSADVQAAVAGFHRRGLPALFRFGADPDLHDPRTVTGDASQGGLGLPNRDYYLKDDEEKVRLRAAYQTHVAAMLELTGETPEEAASSAAAVMEIETILARASLPPAELRDPRKLDNPMSLDQLSARAQGFDWAAYFQGVGRPDLKKINVSTPDFFKAVGEALETVPVDQWKAYLKWNLVNSTAPYLSGQFRDQDFAFYSKELRGVEQQSPRWQTMVSLTDVHLGEAVGQKFVADNFPPEAKRRALEMVDSIVDVLRERITSREWMGDETKKEALAKLDTLVVKIGYPDEWKDYSALEVRRDDFFGNVMRSRALAAQEKFESIGQPVDRGKWEMTPATVNAYYHPSLNEIVFPAARLQPPFFDVNADDAANLGSTGVTIGHELTHGFDDSGSQFDSQGRLRDWWQPEDRVRFEAVAQGVTDQMDAFSYQGVQQNGKLVTGEALADQGGLELAYEALERSLADNPVESSDELTPQQRFFASYAVARQTSSRPEAAKEQMQTDPHPLGPFRVNGPLANMPAFYEAFDVGPGDALYRREGERNRLWDP